MQAKYTDVGSDSKSFIVSILLLLLISNLTIAEVTVSNGADFVSLTGDGFSVLKIHPRVQLFIGDEKQLVDFTPQSRPVVVTSSENTPLGKAVNTTMTWNDDLGFGLDWIISKVPGQDVFTLQCVLCNNSDKDMRIRQFYVMESSVGDVQIQGDASKWMTSSRYLKYARYYDSLGDLQKRGQLTVDNIGKAKDTRYIEYDEDLCIYTNNGKRGLSISPVTDISYCWGHISVPKQGGVGIDFTSEMSGVLVEPGESRKSERVLVQLKPWKDASENLVKWIKSSFQPRNTPPVFGWCSWYCAGSSVTQEHCLDVTEVILNNWDRYPVETIQIDDGWQVDIGRSVWLPNDKFDKGMVHLAEKIKETGSMPGIWMTPISPFSTDVFDKSWCVGYNKGKKGKIDPSSPSGREHIRAWMKVLYDQGYRYFKTDFSQVSRAESQYFDPKLTSYQAQRLLYSIMREAIGQDSYLLACNGGPYRAILGLADATRIGTDSGTKWGFCQPVHKYNKPSNVHGAWFPILQIGNASFYTHVMACDPDVTRLDNLGYANYDPRFNGRNPRNMDEPMPVKLSMESVQTFHSFQGLYGGTMMVSDRIDQPGYQLNNRLRMFEIMHPCTNAKGYNFAGGYDILNKQFGFAAHRPWGNFVCMVVWNPDHKEKMDLAIDLAPTEKVGKKFHLWSFWDEIYLGIQDKSYVFKDVPKYHCRLLRLTEVDKKNRPTLIGSNFHMSMGESEIKDVNATAGGITVEMIPSAAAIEGQLIFYSENPLKINRTVGCQAFVMQSDDNVYTAVITNRDRSKSQHVISLSITSAEPLSLKEVINDSALVKKYNVGTMTILK